MTGNEKAGEMESAMISWTFYADRMAAKAKGAELDADDLIQEAWIAGIGAAETWRGDGGASLETHVTRRGLGGMLDARRKAARNCRRTGSGTLYKIATVIHASSLRVADGRIDKAFDPFEAKPVIVRSRAEFVRTLRCLHPYSSTEERTAVALYLYDELRMWEAGELMGVSEGYLSTLVKRFLHGLRGIAEEKGWAYGDVAELLGVE